MKLSSLLFAILWLVTLPVCAQNIYDARQSVMLQAVVQEDPSMIILSWVADTANGGYTVWRKSKHDTQWGDSLVALGPGSISWTDTTVTVGMGYEYKVLKSLPAFPYGNGTPNFGAGHIYSGIKLPPIHHRGTCLLVIDSTFKQILAPEITRLLSDIEADGWRVQALYVSQTDPVPVVKQYIKSWAQTVQDGHRTLFLLGRIPVPYSGDIAPDGHHSDHKGAWPCDGYYADLDGVWTDQTVNNKTAPGVRNDNIPGDGKFDNNTFPALLQLQVGRVDFSNMTKFPESEAQLLRRYLDKDHAWRTGKTPVMERGLVDNNFGDIEGLGEAGWKNFSTMFGYSNVKDLPYRQTLSTQSFMWSYGCGGGGPESASDISSTTNFTTDSLQTIFTMLFGSYFGDWDYPNDFLRAAIASRTCLASTWGNRPVWFLHHMAMGEHIGLSAQVTMNNLGLYTPRYYGNYVQNALMGDPTLRMHMEQPIKKLSAIQAGLHVQLTWQDPAHALGYFIYKKSATDTVYRLLNQNPVSSPAFTDSCAGTGLISYMVRSVVLRQSGSGTYYNLSTGVYVAIQSDPSPFYATAGFDPLVYYDALTELNTSLNSQSYHWDFGDGSMSTAVQPSHLYLESGNYTVCLVATDACYSDTTCQVVSILSSLPQVTVAIENAVCFGSSTGAIDLSVSGGTPVLHFAWSNLMDTMHLIQDLFPGEYTCTISSETGNSAVYGPYIVDQPAAWLLDPTITMASVGQSNGSVSINPQGGCPPYSFYWNTGENTSKIENLDAGIYCLTISDCNGCTNTYCATVELSNSVPTLDLKSYLLYPNPVDDELWITLDFGKFQDLKLEIMDAHGRVLAQQRRQGMEIQIRWDVRTLPEGAYWLHVEHAQDHGLIPFFKGKNR